MSSEELRLKLKVILIFNVN